MISGSLPLFHFRNLFSVPGVTHAISTRAGGVSSGRCASLNTSYSVGDERTNVDENLSRIAASVGAEREDLFWAYQVHGNAATVVESDTPGEPNGSGKPPRCDILVTRSTGRTLLLRYADCTPILLADPRRRAVAAVHAGWRGTAVRAASNAVRALREAFGSDARDLIAGIGPAIGPCCYAVGQEVFERFVDRPWAVTTTRGGAPSLDLWESNRRDLIEAGVPAEQIESAGICTQCASDRFFSHRANGGRPAGRFAAVIRLS
ncbi:MAG: peptidoglycan editing factor PgeF [Chloroflexi bacterium]|nr:peptidoglycan editing factor PgeF [Chloroflexota bacterium]